MFTTNEQSIIKRWSIGPRAWCCEENALLCDKHGFCAHVGVAAADCWLCAEVAALHHVPTASHVCLPCALPGGCAHTSGNARLALLRGCLVSACPGCDAARQEWCRCHIRCEKHSRCVCNGGGLAAEVKCSGCQGVREAVLLQRDAWYCGTHKIDNSVLSELARHGLYRTGCVRCSELHDASGLCTIKCDNHGFCSCSWKQIQNNTKCTTCRGIRNGSQLQAGKLPIAELDDLSVLRRAGLSSVLFRAFLSLLGWTFFSMLAMELIPFLNPFFVALSFTDFLEDTLSADEWVRWGSAVSIFLLNAAEHFYQLINLIVTAAYLSGLFLGFFHYLYQWYSTRPDNVAVVRYKVRLGKLITSTQRVLASVSDKEPLVRTSCANCTLVINNVCAKMGKEAAWVGYKIGCYCHLDEETLSAVIAMGCIEKVPRKTTLESCADTANMLLYNTQDCLTVGLGGMKHVLWLCLLPFYFMWRGAVHLVRLPAVLVELLTSFFMWLFVSTALEDPEWGGVFDEAPIAEAPVAPVSLPTSPPPPLPLPALVSEPAVPCAPAVQSVPLEHSSRDVAREVLRLLLEMPGIQQHWLRVTRKTAKKRKWAAGERKRDKIRHYGKDSTPHKSGNSEKRLQRAFDDGGYVKLQGLMQRSNVDERYSDMITFAYTNGMNVAEEKVEALRGDSTMGYIPAAEVRKAHMISVVKILGAQADKLEVDQPAKAAKMRAANAEIFQYFAEQVGIDPALAGAAQKVVSAKSRKTLSHDELAAIKQQARAALARAKIDKKTKRLASKIPSVQVAQKPGVWFSDEPMPDDNDDLGFVYGYETEEDYLKAREKADADYLAKVAAAGTSSAAMATILQPQAGAVHDSWADLVDEEYEDLGLESRRVISNFYAQLEGQRRLHNAGKGFTAEPAPAIDAKASRKEVERVINTFAKRLESPLPHSKPVELKYNVGRLFVQNEHGFGLLFRGQSSRVCIATQRHTMFGGRYVDRLEVWPEEISASLVYYTDSDGAPKQCIIDFKFSRKDLYLEASNTTLSEDILYVPVPLDFNSIPAVSYIKQQQIEQLVHQQRAISYFVADPLREDAIDANFIQMSAVVRKCVRHGTGMRVLIDGSTTPGVCRSPYFSQLGAVVAVHRYGALPCPSLGLELPGGDWLSAPAMKKWVNGITDLIPFNAGTLEGLQGPKDGFRLQKMRGGCENFPLEHIVARPGPEALLHEVQKFLKPVVCNVAPALEANLFAFVAARDAMLCGTVYSEPTFEEVLERIKKLDKTSSVGHMKRRFANQGEYILHLGDGDEERGFIALAHLVLAQRRRLEDGEKYHVPWAAHGKEDKYKLTKLDKEMPDVRSIQGPTALSKAFYLAYFGPMQDAWQGAIPEYEVGRDINKPLDSDEEDWLRECAAVDGTDATGWDRSVPRRHLHMLAYLYIPTIYRGIPECLSAWFFENVADSEIHLPDDTVVRKDHGVPSGVWDTIFVNSPINHMLQYVLALLYAEKRFGVDLQHDLARTHLFAERMAHSVKLTICGDDVERQIKSEFLFLTEDGFYDVAAAAYPNWLLKREGCAMRGDESFEQFLLHTPNFVGRTLVAMDGLVWRAAGNYVRTMANMMYEPGDETPELCQTRVEGTAQALMHSIAWWRSGNLDSPLLESFVKRFDVDLQPHCIRYRNLLHCELLARERKRNTQWFRDHC